MPKPEIIGSLRSTYTRVVAMVCEEKGIDYDLSEAELGAPEVRAVHPFGRMPVLRHGDVALFESKAIATYLDLAFPGPRLMPEDPHLAALTEQWVSAVNTTIDQTIIRTFLMAYIGPKAAQLGHPDAETIRAVMPAVLEQVHVLDRAVADTGHLVGDDYTFADVNVMPLLDRLRLPPDGAQALARAPNLAAYYETHARRPAFVATTPPAGPPKRAGD
jgi:glutathione S-transferase